MTLDIVIRGGQVVDGTGADPVQADVGISDGRIAAVGEIDERGRREIDAGGRLVSPGFVDIHTHLDAQVFWDPLATSSCYHGVSTIVLGNCGVTFAPCRPDRRRYLAEIMETVEDIPADSIMRMLDWDWESYGEFLAALDASPKGVNVGGMVGHCALRLYVMGERAIGEEPATSREIEQMRQLVAGALDAGALGFSTSRTYLHQVPDGRPIPGTHATLDELLGIAEVLASRGRGILEVVPRIGERDGPDRANSRSEMALMRELALASNRPLTFTISASERRPGLWSWVMDEVRAARAVGADLRPQTSVRGTGIIFGLANRTPYDHCPSWAELVTVPVSEQLARLRDPAYRDRLATEAERPVVGAAISTPRDPALMYVLPPGDASYTFGPTDSLAAHAGRMGLSAPAAFLQLALERDGRLLVNYPVLNADQAAVEAMLGNPDVVLGIGDAGAHVGLIMDASWPTFYLAHWVRDRQACSIGEGVRKMTSEAASLFGIAGRGVLRPGAHADVNVFCLDALRLPYPEYCHDFPGGAGRFVQRASGFDYTIVNGEVLMEDGEPTGALPGRTVRSEAVA